MVGLIVTSCKRAYAISKTAACRALVPTVVHCWPIPPQGMLKHSSVLVSVGCLGPGAHKVCLSPLSVPSGNVVWFQMQIHPSYDLAGASPPPLEEGHLLTAAPVPTVLLGFLWAWTWGISSCSSSDVQPLLLTCSWRRVFPLGCSLLQSLRAASNNSIPQMKRRSGPLEDRPQYSAKILYG